MKTFFKLNSPLIMFLLIVLSIFHFTSVYSQTTLNGFNCEVSSLDGNNLTRCGSELNFHITFPPAPNSVAQISLLFPNSFHIISISGGNLIGEVFDVNNFENNGTTLPTGAIVGQAIAVNGSNDISISLGYLNCNDYNTQPLNTSQLFFDCIGYPNPPTNELVYNPTFDINDGLGGVFGNQAIQAGNSSLNPIVITSGNANSYLGTIAETYERTFSVVINSLNINEFELFVSAETDLVYNSIELFLGGSSIPIPFTYDNNNLIDLTDPEISALISSNGNSRTLQFRQSVTLQCAENSPSQVQASVECECGSSLKFNSNVLPLNGSIIESPVFSDIAATLNSIIPNQTTFCSNSYELILTTQITGTSASIDNLAVNFNTQNAYITGVQIGNGTEFSDYLSFTILSNDPDPNQILLQINEDPQNSQITIPGILTTLNGESGSWLDVPLNGSLTFQIKLTLDYECNQNVGCSTDIINLISNGSTLNLNLIGICGTTLNQNLILPSIVGESTQTASITGGCEPFNYVIGQPAPNFVYSINLPEQLPFGLLLGNETIFDCSNVGYRAVFSTDFPLNYNLIGPITNVIINGNPATAVIDNGEFVFHLPNNSSNILLSFDLDGITCPNPGLTFGTINFILRVEIYCLDCPQCRKSLGCGSDLLFVHCPGICTSSIITHPDIEIRRTTYGWTSSEAYMNGDAPVTDPAIFGENSDLLTSRLYPLDLFTVNANGWIGSSSSFTNNSLSFQINSSQLGASGISDFDVVEYLLTMTNGVNTVSINTGHTENTELPTNLNGFPPVVLMNPTSYTWTSDFLLNQGVNINQGSWDISLNLVMRFNPTNPQTGFYPVDMLCQYTSSSTDESNQIVNNQSCDPYGASLLLLIPDVQVAQLSEANGAMFLPDDDESAGQISDPNSCKYGHVVAIKHVGGLGNHVDDFPEEYRPLTSWPANLTVDGLLSLDDIYSGTENYIQSGGLYSNTATPSWLLDPKEKGEIDLDGNYQGLLLTLEKLCLSGGGTVPLTIPINKFAYIHSGHQLSELPDPILPIEISIPGNVPCSQMMNFPGNGTISIPNGLSAYNFNVSSPSGSTSNPVAFQIELLPNNGETPDVVVENFIFNGSLISTQSSGWYTFPDGLPNATSNNASISINLQEPDGCFGESFQIAFRWVAFCSQDKLNAFIEGTETFDNNCFCEQIRTFQRGQSDFTNATITSNFESDGCALVWDLSITNPTNQPTLVLSELNLNFITGLVFESAEIESVCNGNTSSIESPQPQFELIQYQVPSVTFMSNTLISEDITIHPGCTIHYTIRLRAAQNVCNNILNGNFSSSTSLLQAFLEGVNICNNEITPDPKQITINNASLISELNSLAQSDCCVPVPQVSVQHICGSNPGSISISGLEGQSLSVYTLNESPDPDNDLQLNDVYTISNISEPEWFGIVVYANGIGYYTQTINVQDHVFTASFNNTPAVCLGNGFTIQPSLSPTNSQSGSAYIFNWSNGATTNSIQISPSFTTTYTVNVSNGSCSTSASTTVNVNPLPMVTAVGPLEFCEGGSVTLNASGGSNSNYIWSNNTSGGSNTVSSSGSYTVSDGLCPSTPLIVIVNPLPNSTITASGGTTFCQGESVQLTVPQIAGNTYTWSENGTANGNNTNTAIASESNIYQVTVTSPSGCTSSSNTTVTVNETPTVSITGATSICEGESTVLTAQVLPPSASLQWTNGPNTSEFSNLQEGTYIVTATLEACTSSASAQVISLPRPDLPIFTQNVINACALESITLSPDNYTNNSNVTFQWDGIYSNGVNFQNPNTVEAIITNSGTFSLTAIATNGCEAVSDPIEVNLEAEYCSCACSNAGTNQVVPSNITTGLTLQQFVESTANGGGCYYLSHDITITNGSFISINDASFVIGAGVEIYIEPGGSLALDGCQFSGCSIMWKGIRNFGVLDMNNTSIQDAEYAIKLEKYASFNINNLPISTNVRNSTFLKNTYGIFSNSNHNTTHSFFIEKCQFIGNDLLPAYSSMQYWGEKSIAGICVSRINFTVQNNCLFRDLQFGIIAHSSSVIVPNSTFENIRRLQGDHYYLHLYNFFHQMLNLSILNKPSSAAIFGSDSKLIIGKENPIDEALGNDFRGCFVGVFATRTSLIANNNRFSPSDLWSANTGFHIVQPGGNKYFRIDYNEMEVSDRGIFILSPNNLLQGGTYTANANVIRLVDRLPNESLIADNAAIFGIQISSVNQGNGIRLYSNEVLIESPYAKAFGIHTRGTNGIIVKGNIVNRNSDTKGSGFVLEYSNGGILSCNNSTGVELSIEENYGYQTIQSPASRLEGNNSYGTLIGFEYKMINTGTNFERNTMNIHGDPYFTQTTGHGLRLSADNTIIGFQDYKWNRWIDAPTLLTEQAFKELTNDNSNRFTYDPNYLTSSTGEFTFLPTRNQSDPDCEIDQFFNCLADPSNSTPPDDNQYCAAQGSPINGRSVVHSALQLVNDSIEFPYYNDESVYELKRSIYAMQEKEGVILPDSANLDILKQEIDASNIPKFFKVDDLLSKSVLDSTTAQQWAATDSLLSIKERELTELEYQISLSDSILAISLNATREALLFEIDNYKSIINAYLETYQSESEAKKDSIEERNSEITPDRYMETLDKQMNTLFLTSIDSAFVDFSISEQQQIETVASLCPLIGGVAVFKARTLLLLFNDTLFFDDKKICGLEGLAYRKANTNSQSEEIAEQTLQLFPNPTNGILNGSFTIASETSYQFRMHNTLGQLVFEKQIVGQTWEINLKSLNIQSGIYFTELSALDGSNTFKNRVVYVSE